jgi:hypothetical protein
MTPSSLSSIVVVPEGVFVEVESDYVCSIRDLLLGTLRLTVSVFV